MNTINTVDGVLNVPHTKITEELALLWERFLIKCWEVIYRWECVKTDAIYTNSAHISKKFFKQKKKIYIYINFQSYLFERFSGFFSKMSTELNCKVYNAYLSQKLNVRYNGNSDAWVSTNPVVRQWMYSVIQKEGNSSAWLEWSNSEPTVILYENNF